MDTEEPMKPVLLIEEEEYIKTEPPMVRERLELLRVPLDVLPQNQLANAAYELVDSKEGKNIVLLSIWDLLRARRNKEYRTFIMGASLVVPISKNIIGGSRFLLGKEPVRYMPFDFVVGTLTALEMRGLSIYLLGGNANILKKAEKNIRQTFPRLQIVGRYAGSFKKQGEALILEAIRKASPTFLLVGKGVPGGEYWIARNEKRLPSGIRLWCSDLYEVFAEQKKHPSRYVFDRGLEWVGYCFENPLRFFRIFPYSYYNMLLIIYKLFKKNNPPAPVSTS